MSSPLLEFSNSSIVISINSGAPEVIDGRYVLDNNLSSRYLVRCYLVRVQGSKVDTSIGEASGYSRSGFQGIDVDRFLYRGYCLQYASISSGFEHGNSSEDNLGYIDIGSEVPNFLSNGSGIRGISIRHGVDYIADGYLHIIGGVYGSRGIDEIIYENIGGVPITVRGTRQL